MELVDYTDDDLPLSIALETDPVVMAELGGPRSLESIERVHPRRVSPSADRGMWLNVVLEDEPAWRVFVEEVSAFLRADQASPPTTAPVEQLLSPREVEVLGLAADGLDAAEEQVARAERRDRQAAVGDPVEVDARLGVHGVALEVQPRGLDGLAGPQAVVGDADDRRGVDRLDSPSAQLHASCPTVGRRPRRNRPSR